MSIDSIDPDWFPTPNDPEWSDLAPIDLTELDHKFVTILGTPQYQAVMGYLRALIAAQEYSARGLKLTTLAIQLLASNYTVWHYRRQCIDALGGDWESELKQMVLVAEDNPKTYQVWQFRKVCTSKLRAPQNELTATQDYILGDQKNYHVWGYRQWLLRTFPFELTQIMIQTQSKSCDETNKDIQPFTEVNTALLTYLAETKPDYLNFARLKDLTLAQLNQIPLFLLPLWPYEFQFCDTLLLTDENCDVRNNSAWNQRMFVLGFAYSLLAPHPNQTTPTAVAQSDDQSFTTTLLLKSFTQRWYHEVKVVIDSLTSVGNNESAYNYLHGLCALQYKYSPPSTCTGHPRLPVVNPNSPIIAPGLGDVFTAVVKLHQLTLSKCQQKAQDPGPQLHSIQNRFLLSFLVDFFVILAKVQPHFATLSTSTLITSASPDLAQFGPTGPLFTTADQVKALTAALVEAAVAPPQHSPQEGPASIKQLIQTTIELTTALVTADPLRAKYWTFRNIQLNQRWGAELA